MIINQIFPLAEAGFTVNQIARKLKTYDMKIRREVKQFPELEQKLLENGKKRVLHGANHDNE